MNHPRIMEEISRHTWATTPAAMDAIVRAVQVGIGSEDEPIFHAAPVPMRDLRGVGEDQAGRYRYSERVGDVGVVRVEGPITPRSSWLTNASGLTSVDGLSADLADMAGDPAVGRVVMVFDSPGGATTGISELAAQIRGFEKPIASYVYGMAASAAYWLASAAPRVISADTGMVGSVGCVMTLNSKREDGTVEIVSSQSPKKRLDPATESGRAHYQEICDAMAQIFVDQVAENRGVSSDAVLERFGEGGLVVAGSARERGMIDGVSTFSEFLRGFRAAPTGSAFPRAVKAESNRVDGEKTETGQLICAEEKPADAGQNEEMVMTLNELLAQSPEAARELEERIVAARADAVTSLRSEMKFAATIAASSEYPAPIRGLASAVLAGEKSKDALDGAVTVFEAQVEERKSAEAKAAEGTIASTPAQAKEQLSADGKCRSEADFRAAVARARGER